MADVMMPPPPPPEGMSPEEWGAKWIQMPREHRRHYRAEYERQLAAARKRARELLDEQARTSARHGRTVHGHPCCRYAPADLAPLLGGNGAPIKARCGGHLGCRDCATDAAVIHSAGRGKRGAAPLELRATLP